MTQSEQQTVLPLGGIGPARARVLEACRAHMEEVPNGNPRTALDFGCLLVCAASGESGALVRMAQMGLPEPNFQRWSTDVLMWRMAEKLELGSFPLPSTIDSRQADLLRTRVGLLWGQVVKDREALSRRCVQIGRSIRPFLPKELEFDPCQLEPLDFFVRHGQRILLTDEMGLGKTVEALGMALVQHQRKAGPWPLLILCPASLVHNWAREVSKWLALVLQDRVCIVGRDVNLGGQVLICSYAQLRRHMATIRDLGPRMIICDESQNLKNFESSQAQAVFVVRRSAGSGRVALTGTSMPNGRHAELYGQIKFLDFEFFDAHLPAWARKKGDRKWFLHTFCDPKTQIFGRDQTRTVRRRAGGRLVTKTEVVKRAPRRTSYDGRSNEVQLGRYLSTLQMGRTKLEVGIQIGPQARYRLEVPLTTKGRLEMAQVIDQVKAELTERADALREAGQPEQAIKALLGSEAVIGQSRLRLWLGRYKVHQTLARLKDLVAEGHRVLVWTSRHAVAHEAFDLYQGVSSFRVEIATGAMTTDARDEIVQRAQHGGEINVLVLTEAMATGHTLTSFDRSLHVERYWTPGQERQAEQRIWRRGQDKAVAYEYPHVPGSLDDAMAEVVTWKETGQAISAGAIAIRAYEWIMNWNGDRG